MNSPTTKKSEESLLTAPVVRKPLKEWINENSQAELARRTKFTAGGIRKMYLSERCIDVVENFNVMMSSPDGNKPYTELVEQKKLVAPTASANDPC